MDMKKLTVIISVAVLAYVIQYYWKYWFIISEHGAKHIDLSPSIDDHSKEKQDKKGLISFIMKNVAIYINMKIMILIAPIVLMVGFVIKRYYRLNLSIVSGYAAKQICSSVFIADRRGKQQHKADLNWFVMNDATITVNYKDLSVTASVFGFAKRKAIFRKGLGATLISELTEEQIRAQKFNVISPSDVNQDNIPWPMGDKIDENNFPSNINRTLLQEAVNSIFIHRNRGTRAVVVVYDGQMVAEQYASGFSTRSKFLGWSMTKSITSALIGILVEEGRLNIDEPAPVPEWNNINDPRHSITIKNLLQQTTGLNFVEEYYSSSDCVKMLYEKGDMAAFTASHPLKDKPGSQFYYSSGNTNILSRIIRHTVGEYEYYSFPHRKLFSKLGMNSFIMEVDPSGTFVGSSYSWGTARDWARFGLLYLNQGLYNNEQILSKEWIEQTITSTDAKQGHNYGFQFWLNKSEDDDDDLSKRAYSTAPTDMFFANGHLGQTVFIIPSKKLVIVRLGFTNTSNGDYGSARFVEDIINSIE